MYGNDVGEVIMKRRDFFKTAGCGALGMMASGYSLQTMAAESEAAPIRSLFTWDDEKVIRLTERVYENCILGKVFPPEGTLKQRWIGPGGGYRGQWIWDTMFVIDLLSILPGKEQLIRDVCQNYWDFQVRWNAKMPEYAHDMIPCMIQPHNENWLEFPAYSQIPILAWGIERVYKRNGDKELLHQSLKPLEKFHDWYWRERDVTNAGLIAVGAYSGDIQHARYETFDFECNLDDLKLTKHPARRGKNEGEWYGTVCAAGNTAFLIMGEHSLVRLAEVMGDTAMAARRKKRIDKAVKAMRTHMWDEEAGIFLSVDRDSLKKVPVATIGSWMTLAAQVPTREQAKRMAEVLASDKWQTPLPIPTVDRSDSRWEPTGFWRGDVWPATNYLGALGLAHYGEMELAASICDKTVANAIKNGISEHYNSVSGETLGVEYLGMTCTLVTMMLDRLTREYRLRVK
jgi:putative isomerase